MEKEQKKEAAAAKKEAAAADAAAKAAETQRRKTETVALKAAAAAEKEAAAAAKAAAKAEAEAEAKAARAEAEAAKAEAGASADEEVAGEEASGSKAEGRSPVRASKGKKRKKTAKVASLLKMIDHKPAEPSVPEDEPEEPEEPEDLKEPEEPEEPVRRRGLLGDEALGYGYAVTPPTPAVAEEPSLSNWDEDPAQDPSPDPPPEDPPPEAEPHETFAQGMEDQGLDLGGAGGHPQDETVSDRASLNVDMFGIVEESSSLEASHRSPTGAVPPKRFSLPTFASKERPESEEVSDGEVSEDSEPAPEPEEELNKAALASGSGRWRMASTCIMKAALFKNALGGTVKRLATVPPNDTAVGRAPPIDTAVGRAPPIDAAGERAPPIDAAGDHLKEALNSPSRRSSTPENQSRAATALACASQEDEVEAESEGAASVASRLADLAEAPSGSATKWQSRRAPPPMVDYSNGLCEWEAAPSGQYKHGCITDRQFKGGGFNFEGKSKWGTLDLTQLELQMMQSTRQPITQEAEHISFDYPAEVAQASIPHAGGGQQPETPPMTHPPVPSEVTFQLAQFSEETNARDWDLRTRLKKGSHLPRLVEFKPEVSGRINPRRQLERDRQLERSGQRRSVVEEEHEQEGHMKVTIAVDQDRYYRLQDTEEGPPQATIQPREPITESPPPPLLGHRNSSRRQDTEHQPRVTHSSNPTGHRHQTNEGACGNIEQPPPAAGSAAAPPQSAPTARGSPPAGVSASGSFQRNLPRTISPSRSSSPPSFSGHARRAEPSRSMGSMSPQPMQALDRESPLRKEQSLPHLHTPSSAVRVKEDLVPLHSAADATPTPIQRGYRMKVQSCFDAEIPQEARAAAPESPTLHPRRTSQAHNRERPARITNPHEAAGARRRKSEDGGEEEAREPRSAPHLARKEARHLEDETSRAHPVILEAARGRQLSRTPAQSLAGSRSCSPAKKSRHGLRRPQGRHETPRSPP
ncbi:hypothetical protein CYMTET_24405 [Cymbomonas tetramitiformis]|uniref:Uncharacterized protein n=1 Tax=Cymbomonas tetramitiformis TaxID=36881 RepID=A0AAE0FWD4_9CHLO|nr:hypothetical protein CYMTET_24405 [Cymbomonas tetramitiformis]